MNSVKDIESAISRLTARELMELRTWFDEFDQRVWDEKIADDQDDGELKRLAAEAQAEVAGGDIQEM